MEDLEKSFQHLDFENGGSDPDCLVISIDFGTTFSGVAYGFSTDPSQVYCITSWPGADGRKVPKAPTIIRYDDSEKTDFQWGYQLDPTSADKIEGIKLLLDPEQPRPFYVPNGTEAEIDRLKNDVVKITSDDMRAIHQHALKEIDTAYLAGYIESYKKRYVISVPAVWSDKAKNLTLQAARNAGISPVELIKEPEAAALYTLHCMKNKGLQAGDAIVVCDAGGGTVDLISYEIISLRPFKVKEIVPCSGGLSGSLMLNRSFERWIQETVGDAEYRQLKNTDGYRAAMQQFDLTVKPAFRSEKDRDRYLSFPMANLKDDHSKGIVRNAIKLKGTTLFNIFNPLFQDIHRLITEQVHQVRTRRLRDRHPNGKAIKAILLVGGFGSSIYLREAISASHPDIQVIQPNDAWSAIVKGGVLSMLPEEAVVVSNVAEKHYGTAGSRAYDPKRDQGQRLWMCEWKETLMCNTMEWFIHKDDELVRKDRISINFYRQVAGHDPWGDSLVVQDYLYESITSSAPVHRDKAAI
ncbi:hypothetical protein VTN02DRAFT_2039 [Thermoascus thermophilus]